MSSSKKTDDHIGGIAAAGAYPRPQKRTRNFTREIAGAVLRDLQAVVVDYFGGLVIGRLTERDRLDGGKGSLWLPLERFTELDEKTLCHKLKIMPFLPTEWNSRRRDLFESSTGYRLTESVAAAHSVATGGHLTPHVQTTAGQCASPENGWQGLPLPYRIDAVLRHRKLKRTEFASIFGVTPGAVTRWLYGLKRDKDLAKAKRLPEDLAALMVRWIETGVEPTSEELVALPSRHRAPRAGPRGRSKII